MDTRKDIYSRFVCIAAGESSSFQMLDYSSAIKVPKYVKYYKKDAKKLQDLQVGIMNAILGQRQNDNKASYYEAIEIEKEYLEDLDPEEFFEEFTNEYEHDEEGNAVSDINPNGKFNAFYEGKMFSVPFILKDGTESFSAKKGDIDWEKMHGNNVSLYERVWEMVMEGAEPQTENEKQIKENMSERVNYLSQFETKENYVASNTSFWAFAFLSDETGWVELEDDMDQFIWVKTFYDLRIKLLPDDTLLTIYECCR